MLFSYKKLSFITACSLLSGCTTSPNVPSTLPPLVEPSSMIQNHVLSKEDLFQMQSSEVQKALKQYEKTRHASVIETNLQIVFPFGQMSPQINCTPLHTCDIKLDSGEKITGVYPGDTSRWLFEEAISGEDTSQQMHVIFKPKDYDIATNAIITTTKRTYHVDLYSKKDVTVKQIAFYYPEDFEEEWKALQKEAVLNSKTEQQQESEENNYWSSRQLNFHYKIETPLFGGKPLWTPTHVFNDGAHVYIEMPAQAATTSLPALFLVGKDNKKELVNYRVQKPYYVVDELFHQAILDIGSGLDEEQVTMTYTP